MTGEGLTFFLEDMRSGWLPGLECIHVAGVCEGAGKSEGFDFLARKGVVFIGEEGTSFGEPGNAKGDKGCCFGPEDESGMGEPFL